MIYDFLRQALSASVIQFSAMRYLALLLCALLFTACSQYDRRWKNATTVKTTDPLTGAWQGHWKSQAGAEGKLWCILTNEGTNHYHADFKATWHGVFSSQHQVVLQTKGTGRERTFTGDAMIRMFIGSGAYHCEGHLSPTRLSAHYDATYDRGTFDLHR